MGLMYDEFKSYTPGFAFIVSLALLATFLTPIAGMKRLQRKDDQQNIQAVAGVTNPSMEE